MSEAERIIARFQLQPLPREGGWFRRVAVSAERHSDGRPVFSFIHFLMTPRGFSAIHRLKSEEAWEFIAGAPVELWIGGADGTAESFRLSAEIGGAGRPTALVPAGAWQGARTTGEWSLLGCQVTPAWEEAEFALGQQEELLRVFPAHAAIIRALTR